MKAILLLEDGTTFEGESIGASGTTIGEAVFATAMTGYQEMLTDPSFAGQLLTLTYPLVGNYGVNPEDVESGKIQVEGFIVRELCEEPSNWRSSMSLRDYLTHNGTVAMQGIDTRALTRHLRVSGVMMGAMSTELTTAELKNATRERSELRRAELRRAGFDQRRPTSGPATSAASSMTAPSRSATSLWSTWESSATSPGALRKRAARLRSCRAMRPLMMCLRLNPDGVVFSPGPGDPRQLKETVKTMRSMIGKKPILGICLGHQMFGMAMGGDIIKLKFGHRGANHPVKNLINGKVSITAQNHGYAVDPDELVQRCRSYAHKLERWHGRGPAPQAPADLLDPVSPGGVGGSDGRGIPVQGVRGERDGVQGVVGSRTSSVRRRRMIAMH